MGKIEAPNSRLHKVNNINLAFSVLKEKAGMKLSHPLLGYETAVLATTTHYMLRWVKFSLRERILDHNFVLGIVLGIAAEDIADGNQKAVLGLMWTLVTHFQLAPHVYMISNLTICRRRDNSSFLLIWVEVPQEWRWEKKNSIWRSIRLAHGVP